MYLWVGPVVTVAVPARCPEKDEFLQADYRFSESLPQLLDELGASLLVSTYQAKQVASVGVAGDNLHVSFRRFDQPMGIALDDDGVAVVTKEQVWFLRSHPELAPQVAPAGTYDTCLVPHRTVVTGGVQGHEIAWGRGADGERALWFVNTAFSCLAGLDDEHHFVPLWKPPFISELAPGDRCHLNGMAMRDGLPAFVSVMARTDEPGGWRAGRNDSGALLHVPSGEPVTTGLSMPHSPRWHDGQLYVLNSGFGRLERVDVSTGARDVVALLPGYARGLAFHGPYAFIGLSKIRETAIFGGSPIAEYHDQLKCGVGVVDLRTGSTVATLEFTSVMHEIFDVQVLAGARCATLGGTPGAGDEVWRVAGNRV